MKKKIIALMLAVMMLCSMYVPSHAASVSPTKSAVMINGERVEFQAYNIDGNNYFKLRDIAFALNGTEAQFEISWDPYNRILGMSRGLSYTPNGQEMTNSGGDGSSAVVSSGKMEIDACGVLLRAYNIGGNNYFKLRDLAQQHNFAVEWDAANQTISIDTSKGYTMPGVSLPTPHVNSYPLLLLGMRKGVIDDRLGEPSVNYTNHVYDGLLLAYASSFTPEKPHDLDYCTYVGGNFSRLVNNCPASLSLSEVRSLFGNGEIFYDEMDCEWDVGIYWAGYYIFVDSDAKGNVRPDSYFYVNLFNGYQDPPEADTDYDEYVGQFVYNDVNSENVGNKVYLTVESCNAKNMVISSAQMSNHYGTSWVIAELGREILSSSDGVNYTANVYDSWFNSINLTVTLNDDGSVSISTIIWRTDSMARYVFDGSYTLRMY